MALSEESPSKIYELRQHFLKPDEPDLGFALAALKNYTGALERGSSRDWFCPSPKAWRFDDPLARHTVFHYSDLLPRFTSLLRESIQASARWHDVIHAQLQSEPDRLSRFHQDLRPSSIFTFRLETAPTPSKLKPQERRYKELNAKYYAGTITRDEELELARVEEALNEADAADPGLLNLKKKVNEGYDKLQTGLTQINRILDELLKD
jgi:hypothetical protein